MENMRTTRRFVDTAVCTCFIIVCSSHLVFAAAAPSSPDTAEKWNALGLKEIETAEAHSPIKHRAKNVILFLGDGMGISTVTAGRILKGGEESLLYFETFPNLGLSKTYATDRQVVDSAASATAFQCGVKTNNKLLGLDPRVHEDDCTASLQAGMQLTSILDWSIAEGKSVGVVTNTRITHATPGGAYANSPSRDWEGDSELPDTAVQGGCRDIARQLVEDYPDLLQVIMGGGRQFFLPMNASDPNTGMNNSAKGRRDFRNLPQEWLSGHQSKGRKAHYVWNAQELRSLDLDNTEYLFGLFSQNHMEYEKKRNNSEQPSLTEMTQIAINILSKNPKGFYLLVEGGRIDHSHHDNVAYLALYETVAFSDAIEAAAALTSDQETLTVTTADHSHTLVVAGYQPKGQSIFGLSDEADQDGNLHSTLLYGTGPGYRYNQTKRTNTTTQEAEAPSYLQESVVPMDSSTHGGEDVGIYAKGPMAHLFHSVHEESYVAHVMAYASCVGQYKSSGKCPPLKGDISGGVAGTHGLRQTTLWLLVLISSLLILSL